MAVTLLNPYVAEAEVRAELKNQDVAIADDILRAINQASRVVDRFSGRDFFQHDYTATPLKIRDADLKVFDGELLLPYYPVISIVSVTEAGVALVEGTDYIIVEGYKLVRISEPTSPDSPRRSFPVWSVGNSNDTAIQINGKFGYAQAATTDVPTGLPDWVALATRIAAAVFSGYARRETVGMDGQRTELLTNELPKTFFNLIERQAEFVL